MSPEINLCYLSPKVRSPLDFQTDSARGLHPIYIRDIYQPLSECTIDILYLRLACDPHCTQDLETHAIEANSIGNFLDASAYRAAISITV